MELEEFIKVLGPDQAKAEYTVSRDVPPTHTALFLMFLIAGRVGVGESRPALACNEFDELIKLDS